MKIYNIFFLDFFFKSIYCLISFVCTLAIFFLNINNFFLFETLPFLKLFHCKRFIITQITHLFNVVWTLSFFYSLILVFPLIVFKYFIFFESSWSKNQKKIYYYLLSIFFLFYLFLFFFCHLTVIPCILIFFLSWELVEKSSLLRIETEISFYYYFLWLISFKNNLSLIATSIFILFMLVFLFKRILTLYYLFKCYKNLLGFALIVFIYLLIPPDFIIQLIFILLIYFTIEFLLLFFCILFYKYLKILKCLQ